jgi:hemerythrin-like domain-containing protein
MAAARGQLKHGRRIPMNEWPLATSMKITDAFIGEHAVLYAQLDHLEYAVPAAKTLGEIKAMAGLLEAALTSHAALEDDLLFDGLDPGLDQMGKLEKVRHEHDAICKGLAHVRVSRTRKDAERRLLNVVHLTRKEFDLEDRILFRLAEELLREDTLQKLGKEWAQRRIVPTR